MDFSIKAFNTKNAIAQHKSSCIAVGVYEGGKLSASAKALDLKGSLTAAVKSGDITGKAGTTLLVHRSSGPAKRVLLVGLGAQDAVSDRNFISAIQSVTRVFSLSLAPMTPCWRCHWMVSKVATRTGHSAHKYTLCVKAYSVRIA